MKNEENIKIHLAYYGNNHAHAGSPCGKCGI